MNHPVDPTYVERLKEFNPNGIHLIEGEWYLVEVPVLKAGTREEASKELAMKFTKDSEDAYYVSEKFSRDCKVKVICALRKHYD